MISAVWRESRVVDSGNQWGNWDLCMHIFVGIDGFRWGWVAAWIDSRGHHGFDYSSKLDRLLSYPHTMAMIDIPIGLPTKGLRACDRDAQQMLGSSVFTGVRRGFWNFANQSAANEHYWDQNEPGISSQLWSIRWKIKHVDELMTPDRQRTLHETHPELVFWNLNKRAQLSSKHTEAGRERRISLLKSCGFTNIDRWLSQRWGTGIGRDDLIDACVCAVAARDARTRIPEGAVPVDSKGLKMEMWFVTPKRGRR
jgi:predicted RNase H-like nuclease